MRIRYKKTPVWTGVLRDNTSGVKLCQQFFIGAGARFIECDGFDGEGIEEDFEGVDIAGFEDLEQIDLEEGVEHGACIFVEESPDATVGEDSPLEVCGAHLFIEFVSGGITGVSLIVFDGFVEVCCPGGEFSDTAGAIKEGVGSTAADMGEESICAVEQRVFDTQVFAEGFVVAVCVSEDVKGAVDQEESHLRCGGLVVEVGMMAFKMFAKLLEFIGDFFAGEQIGSSEFFYCISCKKITGIHDGCCHGN